MIFSRAVVDTSNKVVRNFNRNQFQTPDSLIKTASRSGASCGIESLQACASLSPATNYGSKVFMDARIPVTDKEWRSLLPRAAKITQ